MSNDVTGRSMVKVKPLIASLQVNRYLTLISPSGFRPWVFRVIKQSFMLGFRPPSAATAGPDVVWLSGASVAWAPLAPNIAVVATESVIAPVRATLEIDKVLTPVVVVFCGIEMLFRLKD